MLKRFTVFSGFAAALLFAIAVPAQAGDGCGLGGQSVGITPAVPALYAEADSGTAPGVVEGSDVKPGPGQPQDESAVTPAPMADPGQKEGESPPEESIGTGTMPGEGDKNDVPAFGGNTWDAILGITPARQEYMGPWRDGGGP
jgi:hypothetical protein